MLISRDRFGAAVALGVFLLSSPMAYAWSAEEIAHCTKYNSDGRIFTPNGRTSKGGLGCESHYEDPTWTPEKEWARSEAARKAEEEWVRKGGKPDRDNGVKKYPLPAVVVPERTLIFNRM